MSGAAVDSASAQETLAEPAGRREPAGAATRNTGLDAATWYGDMSTTIGDTRKVADQRGRPDHRPAEHPEVERDQEAAAHQHRHAAALSCC